jgi:hypothetical protein
MQSKVNEHQRRQQTQEIVAKWKKQERQKIEETGKGSYFLKQCKWREREREREKDQKRSSRENRKNVSLLLPTLYLHPIKIIIAALKRMEREEKFSKLKDQRQRDKYIKTKSARKAKAQHTFVPRSRNIKE